MTGWQQGGQLTPAAELQQQLWDSDPEGWALYQTPGPRLKGTDVPADFHYFNWTDSHNIMQMGKDTPFLTGSDSDSLIALNPQTNKWTYFVIPYPPGFPIMVPGQVITQETIDFMRKLDVKEIHGYDATEGLKLVRPEALAKLGERHSRAHGIKAAAE